MPARELEPARWLVEAVTEFTGRVEQLMPAGYDRCVRIFHRPDQGLAYDGAARSWAEVATRHGTTLHQEAQWTALTGGRVDSPHRPGPESPTDHPLTGSLDRGLLSRLSEVLAAHTTTPEVCHFTLYKGIGTAPLTWHAHPGFSLPDRTHWLFAPVPVPELPAYAVELAVSGLEEQSRQPGGIRGLVTLVRPKQPEDSVSWVRRMREDGVVQSPSWWWPQDRAWVVHTEFDYDSTLVACSSDAARALLDDPEIECLRVSPSTSLLINADRVNGG